MATSPTLLSIDEYLSTSYHPDADYVDGEIEERNLGKYPHSKIQSLIHFVLMLNRDAWGIDAIVEQRIRVSPSRVRVCDVAVLQADTPYEDVTATPPLLCIEILSPEDRFSRAEIVLADYFAMGVPNIWLIDPIRQDAFVYDGTALRVADPANLTVAGTPIRLDLTAMFAELDKKMQSEAKQ
jgi:Uma2 family endonuclease